MMNADNVCQFTGNLTRDPEFFEADGDKSARVKFTIAVNRLRDEKPNYIDCVAWNKAAETIATYCFKGSQITVVGEMNNNDYITKDGSKRYHMELTVDAFRFRGKKSDRAEDVAPNFEKVEQDIPF